MYDSELTPLAFSTATKPPNFLVLGFWFLLTSKHQTGNMRSLGLCTVTVTEAGQNTFKKLQTRGHYRKLQVLKHCVYKEYWLKKKKSKQNKQTKKKHYNLSSLCQDAHEPIQTTNTYLQACKSDKLVSSYIFKTAQDPLEDYFQQVPLPSQT